MAICRLVVMCLWVITGTRQAWSQVPKPPAQTKQEIDQTIATLTSSIKARELPGLLQALKTLKRLQGDAAAVPALLEILKEEEDDRVRWFARLGLIRLGPQARQAVPALQANLKAKDLEIRTLAAIGLSWIDPEGAEDHVPVLVAGLKQGRARLRQETAWALGQMGPKSQKAVPALQAALTDMDVGVRQSVAHALGQIGAGAKEALPALKQALHDPDRGVSVLAAAALQAIDPDKAQDSLSVLLEGLKPKEEWIRREAVAALGEVGPAATEPNKVLAILGKALKDTGVGVRQKAALALARFGSRAKDMVAPLVQTMSQDADQGTRIAAAIALSYIDLDKVKEAIALFRAGLKHDDVTLRMESVSALGWLGAAATAAAPDLRHSLEDEDALVRQESALSLGLIGIQEAVPDLEKALKDEDPGVRALATVSLSWLNLDKAKAGIGSLRDGLGHTNPRIRLESALALGRLGPPAKVAVGDLVGALKDGDNSVQVAAASALTLLDPKKAQTTVSILREGLKHENVVLRREGAQGLLRLGSAAKEAVPDLLKCVQDEDYLVTVSAAEALGLLAPEKAKETAVPVLAKWLDRSDPSIRIAVAGGLGRMGGLSKSAVSALCNTLVDKNPEVRFSALFALGQIGPGAQDAVCSLLKAVKDSETRVGVQAITSLILIDLNKMRQAKGIVLPVLLKGLEQSDVSTRFAALTDLGFLGPEAKSAVPAIVQAMQDKEPQIRLSAAFSLMVIDPNKAKGAAIPVLIEALKSPLPDIRKNAAISLRQLGPDARQAIPALTEVLGDDDVRVHTAAADALVSISQ
jgi:HEAT repeat protein